MALLRSERLGTMPERLLVPRRYGKVEEKMDLQEILLNTEMTPQDTLECIMILADQLDGVVERDRVIYKIEGMHEDEVVSLKIKVRKLHEDWAAPKKPIWGEHWFLGVNLELDPTDINSLCRTCGFGLESGNHYPPRKTVSQRPPTFPEDAVLSGTIAFPEDPHAPEREMNLSGKTYKRRGEGGSTFVSDWPAPYARS